MVLIDVSSQYALCNCCKITLVTRETSMYFLKMFPMLFFTAKFTTTYLAFDSLRTSVYVDAAISHFLETFLTVRTPVIINTITNFHVTFKILTVLKYEHGIWHRLHFISLLHFIKWLDLLAISVNSSLHNLQIVIRTSSSLELLACRRRIVQVNFTVDKVTSSSIPFYVAIMFVFSKNI